MLKNRSAEKDIRDHLTNSGYFGRSAFFEEIELHAVQRPGWLQIIRFSVRAKPTTADDRVLLFGVMKDDERFKICEIHCFRNSSQRSALLEKWSAGLTRPSYCSNIGKTFTTGRTLVEMFVFFAIISAFLMLISFLS